MTELVDITPDVSLLAKVGQAGHSVAEAVAELVDNAIDARVDGGPVTVHVGYDLKEGWLEVRDDGTGMTRAQLADALVLGLSHKASGDIGHFGLGLKTACTSLGSRFTIISARQDAHYAWVASYDEDEFLNGRRWTLPLRRQKKPIERGTLVSIESSRLYPALYASLYRTLSWTFRHFLADGLLVLAINGDEVEAAQHDVLEDSVLPFEGEVRKRAVRGWVGLLGKSSQRGWYGFSLVRHRRVVRRHEKLGFQAHPSTARVVGEVHLDEFDTNNLKTDFIRETAAWRELEEWLSKTIEPVVAASRTLAHAGMLDMKIRTHLEAERGRLLRDPDDVSRLTGKPQRLPVEAGTPISVAIGPLHLRHVYVRAGAGDPYMAVERITRTGDSDLIEVRSNLDHPAAGTVADRSGFACHNLAEIAALELKSNEEFVRTKSTILARLLNEKRLRRALAQAAREETPPQRGSSAQAVS